LKEIGVIDYCIENEILSNFLQKHYAEVAKMINLQYNQDAEFEIIRQEAREEGIAEGIEQGRDEERIETARKLIQKNMIISDISEITGLSKEDIEHLMK